MKRVIYLTLSLAIAAFAGFLLTWFVFPYATANVLIALNNSNAGLTERVVQTDIGEVGYLEGGSGQTIVLVHGIYARKEHWVEVAEVLVDDYRVIALDLPGFGDNEALPREQYTLDKQHQNLANVLDALGIEKAHIGANSMGAHIAGLLAARQPDRVLSLAFIGSPLGVPSPIPSGMEKALAKGDIPLLAQSREDFEARNDWLSPNRLQLPYPILKSWMDAELAQPAKNEEIWHAVHSDSEAPNLVELAPSLQMKTLIIWCQPDRIFHVSGAAVLADQLSKPSTQILDNCGHVPMIDKPGETAQVYLEFLRNTGSSIMLK